MGTRKNHIIHVSLVPYTFDGQSGKTGVVLTLFILVEEGKSFFDTLPLRFHPVFVVRDRHPLHTVYVLHRGEREKSLTIKPRNSRSNKLTLPGTAFTACV